MRKIIQSEEFSNFFHSLPAKAQTKILYALNILTSLKVVSTKLVKRLVGTEFYELRISVDNEYRIILFCVDKENFMEASQILLLNGFLKKSTKDYNAELKKAEKILRSYENED